MGAHYSEKTEAKILAAQTKEEKRQMRVRERHRNRLKIAQEKRRLPLETFLDVGEYMCETL